MKELEIEDFFEEHTNFASIKLNPVKKHIWAIQNLLVSLKGKKSVERKPRHQNISIIIEIKPRVVRSRKTSFRRCPLEITDEGHVCAVRLPIIECSLF